MHRLWIFLVVFVLALTGAAAQDTPAEEHPLVKMLGYVPGTSVSLLAENYSLSYTDYSVIMTAREGVPVLENIEDFTALRDGDDEELFSVWLNNFFRVNTGLDLSNMFEMEGMVEALGFSLFEIDQIVMFGLPPDIGTVMLGDFDYEAIQAALEARGYQAVEINGVPVMCPQGDCEATQSIDFADRNPGNPFGGALGRKEAFVLLPDEGVILNSASIVTITAMLEARSGETLSAIEEAAHAALVAGVTLREGTLAQVTFTTPVLGGMEAMDLPEMPAFALGALVDRHLGEQSAAEIALLYAAEVDAQAAIEPLQARIEAFETAQAPRFEAVGISPANLETVSLEEGRGLVVISYVTDYPALDAEDVVTPALGFRVLMESYMRRQLTPVLQ